MCQFGSSPPLRRASARDMPRVRIHCESAFDSQPRLRVERPRAATQLSSEDEKRVVRPRFRDVCERWQTAGLRKKRGLFDQRQVPFLGANEIDLGDGTVPEQRPGTPQGDKTLVTKSRRDRVGVDRAHKEIYVAPLRRERPENEHSFLDDRINCMEDRGGG